MIRDTEPHERALFSVDPNLLGKTPRDNSDQSSAPFGIENAVHGRKSIYAVSEPANQSIVAKVLGSEMLREIRHTSGNVARSKSGVDVEVLLRGAEKLCEVYAVTGTTEKISALRNRYTQITESVASYEGKVHRQQSKLNRMNTGSETGEGQNDDDVEVNDNLQPGRLMTEQDFQREEEEIRDLEARKKALEERVTGIEKDLGGLLR